MTLARRVGGLLKAAAFDAMAAAAVLTLAILNSRAFDRLLSFFDRIGALLRPRAAKRPRDTVRPDAEPSMRSDAR